MSGCGRAIARRMGLTRPLRVLISSLADGPTVIGWLRPVVLLPSATLLGLTTQQLEAVLAHELAHIRRCDYLVNLLQMAVETLALLSPGRLVGILPHPSRARALLRRSRRRLLRRCRLLRPRPHPPRASAHHHPCDGAGQHRRPARLSNPAPHRCRHPRLWPVQAPRHPRSGGRTRLLRPQHPLGARTGESGHEAAGHRREAALTEQKRAWNRRSRRAAPQRPRKLHLRAPVRSEQRAGGCRGSRNPAPHRRRVSSRRHREAPRGYRRRGSNLGRDG